jgi:integrase
MTILLHAGGAAPASRYDREFQETGAVCQAPRRGPSARASSHQRFVGSGENVPLPYVRDILGHTAITTTMIYAHSSSDHLRRSMRSLDGLIAP